MKKLLIFILFCAVIAGGFYLGMKLGEKESKSEPTNTTATQEKTEEKTTEESDEMTDEDYYEKAAEYVRVESQKDEEDINTKPEYHKFVSYHGFGVAEEDGITYAYMWIFDMSYYKEDGKVEQGSGSSMAYKVKFDNEGEVISVENPTDGAGQQESIKKMFPEDVAEKVMTYNFDFNKFDKEVEEYYK